MTKTRSQVDIDLDQLPRMPLTRLRVLWAEQIGKAKPPVQKRLLIRELAWRLQERTHGGLDAETARLLQSAVHAVQRVVRRDGKPTKERRLVRYYVSQKAIKLGYASCPIKTINATRLDDLVRAVVLDHLLATRKLDLAAQPSQACDHWVRAVLDRVVLAPESVSVELADDQIDACRAALASNNLRQTNDERSTTSSQTCPFTPEVEATPRGVMLTLRLQIKRLDGKRMLLSPEGHGLLVSTSPGAAEHIRVAIGRAFAFTSELLRSGEDLSVFASRNGLSDSWLNRLLVLTRLSPAILSHALRGTLPPGVGLDDLMAAAQRLDWSSQAKHLGL